MARRQDRDAPGPLTALGLAEALFKYRIVEEGLLALRLQPGSGPVCLVLGDNASGKSLVRRLLTAELRKRGAEPIPLSMEGRAGPDFTGGMKGWIYGDEDWKSTGHNSAATAETAGRTSRGRTKAHALLMDEPDTGLSERWARSMGRELAKLAADPPPHLAGLFLTTHRVALVRELEASSVRPHAVLVGEGWPATLDDWLAGDPRDPEPLAALGERGMALFRKIADASAAWKKEGGDAG